jgi:hypothetical protein
MLTKNRRLQPEKIIYVFAECGCRVEKRHLKPAPIEIRRKCKNSYGHTVTARIHICHEHFTRIDYRIGTCRVCGKFFEWHHGGGLPPCCPEHAGQSQTAKLRRSVAKETRKKGRESARMPPFRNPDCVYYSDCLDLAARGDGKLCCTGCNRFKMESWIDYGVQRREWSEAVV